MKKRIRSFSGTTSREPSPLEIKNRAIAGKAAEEGIVLLKNDGVLPLEKGAKVALLGGGAGHTIKGGTGSGDVNERDAVSVAQGILSTLASGELKREDLKGCVHRLLKVIYQSVGYEDPKSYGKQFGFEKTC
ncbi:MAG: glycoside hydrolase family 3 C-terminal domain-containing protein [Clostridiales bacterium]|nr:glycoside hydrolase family 3 C-terminal domain-containing protein [Candidatus Blautia equi]